MVWSSESTKELNIWMTYFQIKSLPGYFLFNFIVLWEILELLCKWSILINGCEDCLFHKK